MLAFFSGKIIESTLHRLRLFVRSFACEHIEHIRRGEDLPALELIVNDQDGVHGVPPLDVSEPESSCQPFCVSL